MDLSIATARALAWAQAVLVNDNWAERLRGPARQTSLR